MTDIIPFPARPLRVVTKEPVTTEQSAFISSFIIAMGSTADDLQLRGYIHERQGKLLENLVDESVHHLGHDAVIEMLESMLLHLRNDKR